MNTTAIIQSTADRQATPPSHIVQSFKMAVFYHLHLISRFFCLHLKEALCCVCRVNFDAGMT